MKTVAAGAARQPLEHLFDRLEVEHTVHLGLVDGACELLLGEDVTEIYEGPGDAGGGNGADARAVLRVDAPGAVKKEACGARPGTRGRYLDPVPVPDEAVGGAGRPVAEQSVRTACQHRGQLTGAGGEGEVADRVDASMEAVQPAVGEPACDALPVDFDRLELRHRHHAVLA